ncbi:MAG: AI-2E family transporter [Candidatus Aminicenantes bacterium]|nr:MAG: AI-2E family transporter [Candidatus Aminicenantes bacterium]
MKKKRKFSLPPPLTALIVYTGIVLILILSLKHITLLAAPVFFSFVIAYLFNPLVGALERKTHISRGVIAGLLMITLVFLFIFLLINMLPYGADQVKQAAEKFPQILEKFSQKIKSISDYITQNFPDYLGKINLMGKIEEMLSNLLTDLSIILVAAFSSLYSVLITLLYLVFIPLISYYFIKDFRKIKKALFGLIPPRIKDQAILRIERMNVILSSFIRGQAIVILILAVLYSVGLSLIGLPFSVLIGVIAGIGDIIPYFGTVIGLIISLIVGFTHFQSYERILLILLVFAVVKGSENWFFYPKIVGREVGLHFVWVLIAIVVFGHLFGFWGLLVAIPSSAGFKMYINDLIKYYKNSQFFKKE